MNPPAPPKPFTLAALMIFSSGWAFLTGIFFALPGLSPWVGWFGIAIAIAYSFAIYVLGQRAMGLALGITAIAVLAVAWSTGFTIVNYMVLMTLTLNFILFGRLGSLLRQHLSWWLYGLTVAGLFSAALGAGWWVGLVDSMK